MEKSWKAGKCATSKGLHSSAYTRYLPIFGRCFGNLKVRVASV